MELDKALIERRFAASFAHYDQLADVQRHICARLGERIGMALDGFVRPIEYAAPRRIFEIGAGTGFLTRELVGRWPQAQYHINDLSPSARHFVEPLFGGREPNSRTTGKGIEAGTNRVTAESSGTTPQTIPTYLWGDAEAVDYPVDVDLIASASTIQWFADMAGFAKKAAAALASGGVLAVATFGPRNFSEIRAAGGAGLDYLPLDALTVIFAAAGLAIEYADEWTETLTFGSPREVLRYVKSLGLNALTPRSITSSEITKSPMVASQKSPSGESMVWKALESPTLSATRIERAYPHPATLTYHPLILVARK